MSPEVRSKGGLRMTDGEGGLVGNLLWPKSWACQACPGADKTDGGSKTTLQLGQASLQ